MRFCLFLFLLKIIPCWASSSLAGMEMKIWMMMTSVRWVKVSLPNLLNKICFQKKMREEVNTAGHKAKPHFNISNCTSVANWMLHMHRCSNWKQDSLSAVNLCNWISEQSKASYFISDFLFHKGLPKSICQVSTKQWRVYETRAAAVTSNLQYTDFITYSILTGKKQ